MKDDEFVRYVQGKMKASGLYLGVTDGDAGPMTIEAFDKMLAGVKLPTVPVFLPREKDDIPESAESKLIGLHPHLIAVIRDASLSCDVDYTVIEGLRTKERQAYLVSIGASKTNNSRHLDGKAADLWPLDSNGKPLPSGSKQAEEALWSDLRIIAGHMKTSAKKLGVDLEWGGDWGWDAPHFQLSRKTYP